MLNFKDWEKTAEDGKTVTMAHPSGHTMKILVTKLPKIQQEAIKRLKLAKGGKVKNFDDGGPTSDMPNPAPNQSPDAAAIAPAPVAAVAPPVQAPPQDVASIQGSGALNPLQQQAQSVLGAQGQELKGAKEQQAIDAQKAQQAIPIDQQQLAAEQQRNDLLQANGNLINKATSDYANWMANNGKIDPQHFAQSMPDAQKVTTALGLIIGGFGGGFSGTGNNPAQNWLNAQQDKDIQAQQQTIENKKTVLGAYQQLFNDNNTAVNATRISDNNKQMIQAKQIADQLGTAQAQANYNAFAGKKILENAALTKEAAGYLTTNPARGGQPSGSTNPQAPKNPDHILSPDAQQKYQQVLYDPTKTPEQKSEIQNEYLNGVQTDKALDQVDKLYPQLMAKRTLGGYLANKINPHVTGAMGVAAAEGLTGGGAGVGAVPVGIAGAAAGEGLGAAVKQGLTAIGGHQEVEYQNAKDALSTIIGGALGPNAHLTPTEIGGIAEQFIPTYSDNESSAKDKLEKLKDKIKTLAKTGALKSAGMTNDK